MIVVPVSLDCCSQAETVCNAYVNSGKKFGLLLRHVTFADWPSAVQFRIDYRSCESEIYSDK